MCVGVTVGVDWQDADNGGSEWQSNVVVRFVTTEQ